jgi:outer membrane protein
MSLYEAARAFDASYLAARSLADSAIFKADQAQALLRPTVAATASLAPFYDPGSARIKGTVTATEPALAR